MKKIVWFVVVLCICVVSCNFNSSTFNEESERENAEKVAAILYNFIKQKDYVRAETLFSSKFFEITDKQTLYQIFVKTNTTLGDYKARQLVDWKTNRVVGSNPSTDYLLIYKVDYDIFSAQETIRFVKEDSLIRIISYNINSDGFLKQ